MRLDDRLSTIRKEGRKVLSIFVTSGFPSIAETVPLVVGMAEAGADLIELGIPFSDPIADGPIIQQSSEAALRNGVTLSKTLDCVREIRGRSEVPLVLMGYANPIYAQGLGKFLAACSAAGVDGTIIADLPLEESSVYAALARESGIAAIFLAAPTTPAARLAELDRISSGFLYCVSITGVTGERASLAAEAGDFLRLARASVRKNPLLVGFGISTPDDARRIGAMCDGVIVGSALIKTLRDAPPGKAVEQARAFVRSMRKALDEIRTAS
jgi:tryptophan synthase alpha chain